LKDGDVTTRTIDPRDVGLSYARLSDLQTGSVEESADAIWGIFRGEKGPKYDIAALNAGAALVVAERAPDLKAGLDIARQALDSGAAKRTLESLIKTSQSH